MITRRTFAAIAAASALAPTLVGLADAFDRLER